MKTKPKRRIDLLKTVAYTAAKEAGRLRFGRSRRDETHKDRRLEAKRLACRGRGRVND